MNVENLVKQARSATGLDDLGDESILGALEILVNALNNEANLHDRGQQSIEQELVNTLSNRLRVENHLKTHPELLDRPIEKPMFVFGLPRTGTTLAINLLNADPARRCLLRWESFDSVPPPTAEEMHAGPRFDAAQAKSEMGLKYAPHISAIHHEDADSPSECQFAMSPSFVSQYYDSMFSIPTYHRWFLDEADYLPAFRYHKRFLQHLQANVSGRWTLKNPWHPLFINELTTVYPDAQLVMTHRDPVDVAASACSLVAAVRPMFSDQVDPNEIADVLLETFDKMIERTNAYRESHGESSIYDLHYADLMKDPIAEMEKLYNHFGEPFDNTARTTMQDFMQQNPKGKHGKHSYSLEDYGLTKSIVRERYRDYCERFNIATKD